MECQLQSLRGLSLVSGFSTGRSTVACQALREFRQLVGNQVHLHCLAIRSVSLHDLLRYD